MKKFLAVLLTLAMVLAFAACGGKQEETPTVDEESSVEEITSAAEEPTEPVSEDVSGEDESSEEVTDEEAEIKAPETTEEIIALYNDTINAANEAKAGFNKERYTDNDVMNMSVALKAFKGLVEKFVGIGAENRYTENVTKGQWSDDAKKAYLRKSTLTASDVTNATCAEDGSNYVITLSIKPGTSKGSKDSKFTSAPVDKCGICVGNEDKGYYDHKTGEVIYDAIDDTYAGAKIDESYSNAKAVAKIDKETGKLVSLTVTYDMSVAIDIGIGSGTATGSAHILYKNFNY